MGPPGPPGPPGVDEPETKFGGQQFYSGKREDLAEIKVSATNKSIKFQKRTIYIAVMCAFNIALCLKQLTVTAHVHYFMVAGSV